MTDISDSEYEDLDLAFKLEHAHNRDRLVTRSLIDRHANDVLRLLGVFFEPPEIDRQVDRYLLTLAATVFQYSWEQVGRIQEFDSVRNWIYAEAIEVIRKKRHRYRRPVWHLFLPDHSSGESEWEASTSIQPNLQLPTLEELLVFFLRYAANLLVPDIAQVTGRSPKSVHKKLQDVRRKVAFASGVRMPKFTGDAIHARVQLTIGAMLDGYLPDGELDEGHRAHLFYCMECKQYAAERESLDEKLSSASQRYWPQPGLDQRQFAFITQQTLAGAGTFKIRSGYIRPLRSVLLFGSIFLAALMAGFFFHSQDTNTGVPLFQVTQAGIPGVAPYVEVPVRMILNMGRISYVSDESGNLVNPPAPDAIDESSEWGYTFYGSDESITTSCLSISPLDDMLATCSHIGRITLWSLEEKKMHLSIKGHTMPVTGISFSPDGSRLAAGSYDGTVTLWDTHSGSRLAELQSNTGAVLSVAISPDGRYLSVGANRAAWIWELASGKYDLVHYFAYPAGEQVNDMAYSSTSELVAHAVSDGSVWVRNATTGRVITRLTGHESEVLKVAFSREDNFLAVGSEDGIVDLWRIEPLADGSRIFTRFLELHHNGWVNDLAFSPNELLLAVAVSRGQLAVWDIHEKGLLTSFLDNRMSKPSGVAFSSDGRYLTTGSAMGGIQIWSHLKP